MVGSGYRGWQGVSVIKLRGGTGGCWGWRGFWVRGLVVVAGVTGARQCAPTGGGGGGMGKGWRLGVGFFALLRMTGGLLGMTGGLGWRVGRVFGLWHVIMVGSGYRGWQGVSVIKLRGGVGDGRGFWVRGSGVVAGVTGARLCAPTGGGGGGMGKGWRLGVGFFALLRMTGGLLGMTGGLGWDCGGWGKGWRLGVGFFALLRMTGACSE